MSNIDLKPGMRFETKTVGEYDLDVDDHIVGDDLIYRVTRTTVHDIRAVPVWSQSEDCPVSGREERPPDLQGSSRYSYAYRVITLVR